MTDIRALADAIMKNVCLVTANYSADSWSKRKAYKTRDELRSEIEAALSTLAAEKASWRGISAAPEAWCITRWKR